MKYQLLSVCLTSLICSAYASESSHWSYSGETGPSNWAKLSPDFSACDGKNQSPINLEGFIESELPLLNINYSAGGSDIINNGHTVQINYLPGSSMEVDGEVFELKQFHFHAPSENHIMGESFPMEAHFVHANEDGNLAVIALMFKVGDENELLSTAWQDIPLQAGDDFELAEKINAADLLPADRDFYRFNGSLTTPPCSEGVRWYVMKDYLTASAEQIELFSKALGHTNNRPVQSVNARVLLQ